jgi:hypothetical protein
MSGLAEPTTAIAIVVGIGLFLQTGLGRAILGLALLLLIAAGVLVVLAGMLAATVTLSCSLFGVCL